MMKGFPSDSVDLVVTDPPYGISFMGKSWDKALPEKGAFAEMFRVLKPGALAFVMSSPRQDVLWRMLAMLEGVGFNLQQSFVSWIYKSGFPKAYDVSKGIDKKFGLERQIVGRKQGERYKYDFKDSSGHFVDTRSVPNNKRRNDVGLLTEPASDLAVKWSGWKSIAGLKPALECVLMVNKPLSERTIVDNVLRWGCGAINIDAVRIPYDDLTPRPQSSNPPHPGDHDGTWSDGVVKEREIWYPGKGRFPANLLVSDGALDTGKTMRGTSVGFKNVGWRHSGNTKEEMTKLRYQNPIEDVGDQSRYFDLDKWAKHYGFLDVPKASKAERNKGLNVKPQPKSEYYNPSEHENKEFIDRFHGVSPRMNKHPTVKPIKLGCYLVELACQPDGIVLDPFCGSGSFCISAKISGRRYVGIDIDPEACGIARARLDAYSFQPRLEAFNNG